MMTPRITKKAQKQAAFAVSLTVVFAAFMGLLVWAGSILLAVLGYNLLAHHIFGAPVVDPVGYLGLLLLSLGVLVPVASLKNGSK